MVFVQGENKNGVGAINQHLTLQSFLNGAQRLSAHEAAAQRGRLISRWRHGFALEALPAKESPKEEDTEKTNSNHSHLTKRLDLQWSACYLLCASKGDNNSNNSIILSGRQFSNIIQIWFYKLAHRCKYMRCYGKPILTLQWWWIYQNILFQKPCDLEYDWLLQVIALLFPRNKLC